MKEFTLTDDFAEVTDEVIVKGEVDESEIVKSIKKGASDQNGVEPFVQVKEEFLAFFLHELRGPLNSISGWTQLLQQGQLDTEARTRAVESIKRNTSFLNNLIDDLLDISRIANGKMELVKEAIDFCSIVETVIEDFTPGALSKNIALIGYIESRTSMISGEEKRLRQIIGNILSNALKFTPPCGHIVVRLSNLEKLVQLEIKDSGIGIKPEHIPFVFDRFWQDETTKSQSGGLGLGLAVARFLTELHGGTIEAQSEGLNKGTTFKVQFPLIQ